MMKAKKLMWHGVDWVLIAILLLATLLRFPGLGKRSLWFDEALSGLIARLNTTEVLTNAVGSSHPPGYYFFLHLWHRVGESEFILRFPSAWFSLVAVTLVGRLSRDLLGRRVARLATLMMALSPFQVYYAQEARMYGLSVALSTGLFWAFLQALRQSDQRFWWLYGILTAFGLYVHYYTGLVVLALHFWLLWDWSRVRKADLSFLLSVDALVGLVFAPQFMQFFVETKHHLLGINTWLPSPTLFSPFTTLYYLVFGHVLPLTYVGVGLFLVLMIVALVCLRFTRRSPPAEVESLIFVVFVPIVLILIISYIFHPVYLERSFAVVTPALMLLLAYGVASASWRSPTPYLGMAFGLLLIIGSVLYHVRPDPAKPPIRKAVHIVSQEMIQGQDTILHLQDASYLPALYYDPSAAGALVDAGQRLWLIPNAYSLFGGRVLQSSDIDMANSNRTWLVVMPGYIGSRQNSILEHWKSICKVGDRWNWRSVETWICMSDEGGG